MPPELPLPATTRDHRFGAIEPRAPATLTLHEPAGAQVCCPAVSALGALACTEMMSSLERARCLTGLVTAPPGKVLTLTV